MISTCGIGKYLIFLMLSAVLVNIEASSATAYSQQRRPPRENPNCIPEVVEQTGLDCNCVRNASKLSPVTGDWVQYRFLCDPSIDNGPNNPECVEHFECDPGDPVEPGDPWDWDDIPDFGLYGFFDLCFCV